MPRRSVPGQWVPLRILVALLLAVLTLPLATSASAEEGQPTAPEATATEVASTGDPAAEEPPAEEPAPDYARAPDDTTAQEPAEQPVTEDPAPEAPPRQAAAERKPDGGPSLAAVEEQPTQEEPEEDPGAYSLLADMSLLALVGGFEIDGNIPVDTPGNLDWENAGTLHRDGFGDLTNFSGSSKEFEHPSLWSNGSSGTAPGKSDIGDVYIYNTTIDGDAYSYFGFTRSDTTGTTAYDVEYNQRPNLSASPPRPDRTPGDLLVQVAQQGSTGFSIQATYVWTLQSDTSWTSSCTPVPGYTPAAGWCRFTPPSDAFDGAVSVDGAFAEGVLNLTALFGGTTCMGDFGVMNIRSRSSEALDAALKDWIVPIAVDIEGTCADLTIVKRDDAGNLVPGATFRVAPDPTPGSSSSTLTVTDGGAGDDDGTADGRVYLRYVEPGDYTVTETATPDGYFFPAQRARTVSVAEGQEAELVFVNPREWEPLSATKTATATYDSRFTWSIEKSVDDAWQSVPEGTKAQFRYTIEVTQYPEVRSDFEVSGDIRVTNPNDDAVVATLTDELDDGTACEVDAVDVEPGAAGLQVSVPAAGTTYDYSCTYPGGTQPAGPGGTNTATLTWSLADYPQTQDHVDDPGSAGTDTATAQDDYTFVVDQATDPVVTVTDTQHTFDPAWTIQADPDGQTVSKSYQKSFAGTAGSCEDYDNTATLTNGEGQTVDEDEQSVEACVGSDLEVSKNVVESLTRTYAWTIEKTADSAALEVDPDTGQVTATYDIEVTAGGYADSGWLMSGTITVTNPNDWQEITLTDVVDEYDGGGTCVVDTSDGLVVPARDGEDEDANRVELDYTCEFDEKPVYDGTNTATVTWDAEKHSTPSGTAEGEADVAESDWTKTLVNDTVTVVDDMATPADETDDVELGELTWSPGLSTTIEHSITLGGRPGTCLEHTNTASVVGEDAVVLDSDDADVEVCSPVALTVSKTADASYDRTYLWDIAKVADDPTTVETVEGSSAGFDYTVTAGPDGYLDDGHALFGEITVRNPNDYMDVTVDITDTADVAGVTCEVEDGTDVVVPAGDAVTVDYTCDVTGVTEANYTGGTNTATATWTATDGQTVLSATGTAPVGFELETETNKTVDVYDDKAGTVTSPVHLGTASWTAGPSEFTYSVDLDGEELEDRAGTCTDYPNTAWISQTGQKATETVTVCVERPLSVEKKVVASYDRTYLWDIDKVADRTRAEVAAGTDALFGYTVTATPEGYRDSGWAMSGTIEVNNPNTYDDGAITADVTDTTDVGGGAACTVTGGDGLVVDPGEKVTLDYRCTFGSRPSYTGKNTATATWEAADGTEKTADHTVPVRFGLDEETDKAVDVYDDRTDPDGDPVHLGRATWNADGDPTELTYLLPLAGEPGTCTDHTNTAWIEQTGQEAAETVTVCVEQSLRVTKDVTASYDRTYLWTLDKTVADDRVEAADGDPVLDYTVTATPDGFTDDGWVMEGTITVTNPNTYADGAVTATVTDLTDVAGGAACTVRDGSEVTIGPDQGVELDYTCTFDSRPRYTGENTATATWTGPDGTTARSTTGTADVAFTLDAETDRTVDVYDDRTDPDGDPVHLGRAIWNADGVPTELTYQLSLAGEPGTCTDHTNTAWIEQTGQEDSVTVVVCRYGDVVVTKTAAATFDRTYEWQIDKSVDRSRVEAGADRTATAGYTVSVTPTGYTDSDWEMTGAVTVHNPNDWADLTIDLEDLPALGEGVSCAFDEDPQDVVARGGTATYPYTCAFEGQPEYAGENLVEVDWADGAEEHPGAGTATTSVPVAFEVDEETDEVVTVVDEMADPETLGQVTWTEGGVPTVFEYTAELSADPGGCETVLNTAVIVETGQEAQATVEVCGAEILPQEQEREPRTPPAEVAPAVGVLPATGAGAGGGLVTTVAGLSLLLGIWLLLRSRRTGTA